MASWLRKLGHAAASSVRGINKVPLLGTALKAVPFVGTGLTVASAGMDLFGGGGGYGPSTGMGGGLPALPGAGTRMGERGVFQNDPNIVKALQPFAISKTNLRVMYRAPKGFVIRRDEVGDPYGIPKALARKYLGWKPGRKPPISAGDWHQYQTAQHVEKKLLKLARKELRGHGHRRGGPRLETIQTVGKTVVGRKVA